MPTGCNKQPRVTRRQGVAKELFKATLLLEKSPWDHTFSKRGTSEKKTQHVASWWTTSHQHHCYQRDQILPPTPASCRSVACTAPKVLPPAMARPGRGLQQVAQLTAKWPFLEQLRFCLWLLPAWLTIWPHDCWDKADSLAVIARLPGLMLTTNPWSRLPSN